MRYAIALLALSLIVGGIGNSTHNAGISELATLALLVSLILLGRAIWARRQSRTDDQREPRS